MDLKTDIKDVVDDQLNCILKHVKEDEELAYVLDPVFGIKRNRVNAELVKTLIRTRKNPDLTRKIISFILLGQNKEGSWNEIHPRYSQPSALATAIIAGSLLMARKLVPNFENVDLARDYVLSQEFEGKFMKSKGYTADHLNVDATCASFLADYGVRFSDDTAIETALRTAEHICSNQFSDGSFPYTTNKGNYPFNLNIPCIHYQGVTLYYLSHIHEVLREEKLEEALIKGSKWLADVQEADGKFKWSKSGLMFAYYLSGAYGFALASLSYSSRWNKQYMENVTKSLEMIKKNSSGLMLRWEMDGWDNFLQSFPLTFKTAFSWDYSPSEKFFRLSYGFYRQIARRRFSQNVSDNVFKMVSKVSNRKVSTVEPFNNYPDVFMTSEVLDCLSSSQEYVVNL
ncbi:prenyltransferase/squalene oxidase repeat-containing protein [Methanobacterium paludis]|uniref:Squalene cyclase C-terminal domain-containing protein n=1 Tax=Methanobacterium paludis (strain DSM 25820 / JCM 18151 / SWAN1) TaxID=868131 RepID=F6D6Z4_METPW|nr:hypothetical protein [Methanobacterium paludis]AEG18361.1 hypothetical protein MSWAN_1346 [Methanobacterium paludis]